MSAGAIPVERGCGRRVRSGVYLECGLSAFGQPVEWFLIDPPHPIDREIGQKLGVINPDGSINARGVRLFERDGVWHVLDVVSKEQYQVADMVEEIRRFGLSRRCELPAKSEYAKLTPDSRIFLAHAHAWVDYPAPHYADWQMVRTYQPCPKDYPAHRMLLDRDCKDITCCAGVWWNDVERGKDDTDYLPDYGVRPSERLFTRVMPSFTYLAAKPPKGADGKHTLAIFARFPITRLVVVGDNGSEREKEALEKASASSLQLDLVEE